MTSTLVLTTALRRPHPLEVEYPPLSVELHVPCYGLQVRSNSVSMLRISDLRHLAFVNPTQEQLDSQITPAVLTPYVLTKRFTRAGNILQSISLIRLRINVDAMFIKKPTNC